MHFVGLMRPLAVTPGCRGQARLSTALAVEAAQVLATRHSSISPVSSSQDNLNLRIFYLWEPRNRTEVDQYDADIVTAGSNLLPKHSRFTERLKMRNPAFTFHPPKSSTGLRGAAWMVGTFVFLMVGSFPLSLNKNYAAFSSGPWCLCTLWELSQQGSKS